VRDACDTVETARALPCGTPGPQIGNNLRSTALHAVHERKLGSGHHSWHGCNPGCRHCDCSASEKKTPQADAI
jgi:hypothetical protein